MIADFVVVPFVSFVSLSLSSLHSLNSLIDLHPVSFSWRSERAQSIENLGKLGNLEKLGRRYRHLSLSSLHSLNSLNSLIKHLRLCTTNLSSKGSRCNARQKKCGWAVLKCTAHSHFLLLAAADAAFSRQIGLTINIHHIGQPTLIGVGDTKILSAILRYSNGDYSLQVEVVAIGLIGCGVE